MNKKKCHPIQANPVPNWGGLTIFQFTCTIPSQSMVTIACITRKAVADFHIPDTMATLAYSK
jgi:hypothetical protein